MSISNNIFRNKRARNVLCALLLCLCFVSGCYPDSSGEENSDSSANSISTGSSTDETSQITVPSDSPLVQVDLSVSRYCRSLLSQQSQSIYDKIVTAACYMAGSLEISGNADDILYVYDCVYYDCAELFYLGDSPKYKNGTLSLDYTMSYSDVSELAPKLEAACLSFASVAITAGMSDYDKVKTVYEYIILHNSYDRDVYNIYKLGLMTSKVARAVCAVGALIDGKSICTGYARATQLLLTLQGVQATLITGHANNGNHAWVFVPLDGEYYFVDSTWGDPIMSSGDEINNLTYNYLCVTTEELTRSHEIDVPYPVPECTATKYNYYYYNNLVYYSADYAAFYALASEAYLSGDVKIAVKIPEETLGEEIFSSIRAGYFVFSGIAAEALSENPALEGISVSSTYSANMRILTLYTGL